MWVRVILSSLPLCVWRKQSSGVQSALVLNSTPPPPLYQIGRPDFCFVVLRCVGCGQRRLVKGQLWLCFMQRLASHPLPTTFVWVSGGASAGRYHSQAPCSFISSVSDCVGVSGAGGPLLSLTPLSPNTHPLSVCWRGPGSFWALALGPLCVCDIRPS